MGANDLAVGFLLVAHFNGPRAVVGNNHQHGRLVAHSSIDFHGVETERTIARRDDDGAVRAGKTRRNAERRAYSNAAQRARIKVGLRREPHAGKAQEVATIGDDDRVRWQRVAKGHQHTVGVHAAIGASG